MNNFELYQTQGAIAGTIKVMGLTAALAAGLTDWPSVDAPVYDINRSASSYSDFDNSIVTFSTRYRKSDFANQISLFYATLYEGQEPLGSDFEAVWDANVDQLYES